MGVDVCKVRFIQHAQVWTHLYKPSLRKPRRGTHTGHTRASPLWGFSMTRQPIDVWGNCSSVIEKVQSSPLHRPGSPFCGSVPVEATWAACLDIAQGFLCGGDGDFSSWIPLGHAADNLGCLQRTEARGGYCPVGVGVVSGCRSRWH